METPPGGCRGSTGVEVAAAEPVIEPVAEPVLLPVALVPVTDPVFLAVVPELVAEVASVSIFTFHVSPLLYRWSPLPKKKHGITYYLPHFAV